MRRAADWVTYDIDADCILNMSAVDSSQESPISRHTNEKDRLSQAELNRMIQKAENFCAEDESNKAKAPRTVWNYVSLCATLW